MKIKRIDTTTGAIKIVSFDDVIENLTDGNVASINKKKVNYCLLNNETIKTGKYEFSRCVY